MEDNTNPQLEKENLAEFEKKLVEVDPRVFEGIPDPKKQRIIRSVVVSMQKIHSGPLPDPDTLKEYNNIIPNGSERIMLMAEKQADHRMRLEKKVIGNQLHQSLIGQIFAFLIGLAALGASTYIIIQGHDIAGGLIGVGGITGLVTAFLKGKSHQGKSLEEKRPRSKGK